VDENAPIRCQGDAVTILAIWFGVAVVVGLLLGYAARRLKGGPKRQLHIRRASNANTEDGGAQHQLASSIQSSMRTNKRYRKRWRI
jgi:type VI protein secretion system component VasK